MERSSVTAPTANAPAVSSAVSERAASILSGAIAYAGAAALIGLGVGLLLPLVGAIAHWCVRLLVIGWGFGA